MPRYAPLRTLILAVIGASLSAPAFPAVMVAESRRAASPIQVDGQVDEWLSVERNLDPKSGTSFAFQNDGRNLYILFVVKKPESERSVASTGMTVLGRPRGRKKAATGVLFVRRAVSAEGYIMWRESQGAVMTEAEKTEVRKTPRYTISMAFAVDAKGSSYGPLRRQTDVDPPDFAVSRQDAEATYEFRIPLESPDLVPGGIGGTPGQPIRISFDWGGTARDSLSTKASREAPSSKSGYVSGTGRTWGQEFLDTFDPMSRPSYGTKKFTFAVDVKLAETD